MTLPFDWVLGAPVSIVASLVLWTSVPWLLLDRRIPWRRLLPAGALTAVGASLYGVATTIYMPRLMETNSERYGLFGVTLVAGRVAALHRPHPGRGDRGGRRVRPGPGALGAPAARPDRPGGGACLGGGARATVTSSADDVLTDHAPRP